MSQTQQSRVLIIDDHVPAVEMLTRLFNSHHYIVYSAYDGYKGLELARLHHPDIILLDVMMPGINGFEVLKFLRESEVTREIPVIFITAKDAPLDIEQGLSLGAVDYIPKPVEPRELIARAKNKIEAQRLKDALSKRTRDLEVLLRVSGILNTNLNVNELIDIVCYLMLDLSEISQISVIYKQNKNFIIKQASQLGTLISLSSESLENVYKNIYPILLENDSYHHYDTQMGYHVLALTIKHDIHLIGAMILFSKDSFDRHDVILLESIAKQANLALRNAELYELKARYAQELETTVEKRTEELISAQKLLARADKLASLGRLAGAIAHEINNPLTPVILNLELIVEDIRMGNQANITDIETTYSSAQRIKRIVERMLQFIRKGKEDSPSLNPIDLTILLQNVINLSRHYFEQNNVQIHFNVKENIPLIYGNSDQLEQVFLNIMLNAKDAMPQGGSLRVKISFDKTSVCVEFEDNGKSIAPEMLQHLFEPFVSTKEKTGSGLGLFVSHEIIKNHSGTIDVRSKEGKGTTFIIHFPFSG